MFGILGLLMLWAFLTFGLYSIWAMYVVPQTFSYMGLTATGALGGLLTLIMDGYIHIQAVFARALAMTASWGEYLFVLGLAFMILIMVWNAIVTNGRTVVR